MLPKPIIAKRMLLKRCKLITVAKLMKVHAKDAKKFAKSLKP